MGNMNDKTGKQILDLRRTEIRSRREGFHIILDKYVYELNLSNSHVLAPIEKRAQAFKYSQSVAQALPPDVCGEAAGPMVGKKAW